MTGWGGVYSTVLGGGGGSETILWPWGPPYFNRYLNISFSNLVSVGIQGYSLVLGWLWGGKEVWGDEEEWPRLEVDVQPFRDMKSPINHSTSDLNPFETMSLRPILLWGGFLKDSSRRVRGVALVIGRGIDLSAIALLSYAFYFCSWVSGGAIVTCLTMFCKEGDSLLSFCRVHSLHSFILNSQILLQVHMSNKWIHVL